MNNYGPHAKKILKTTKMVSVFPLFRAYIHTYIHTYMHTYTTYIQLKLSVIRSSSMPKEAH